MALILDARNWIKLIQQMRSLLAQKSDFVLFALVRGPKREPCTLGVSQCLAFRAARID